MRVPGWKIFRAVFQISVAVAIGFAVTIIWRRADSIIPFVSSGRFPPGSESPQQSTDQGNRTHFTRAELNRSHPLNTDSDVIVFVHIQKTSGRTLDKVLVQSLNPSRPCSCAKLVVGGCSCLSRRRNTWLFSRFSTGWLCGVHPDWTELKSCLDWAMRFHERKTRTRRYLYITMLRDPVNRFISEWRHTQKGADWPALPKCGGRKATVKEIKPCHKGLTWRNVTLPEFMACSTNPARNRQTRMLADMTRVHCYRRTGMRADERERIMLESAKENLKKMAFFGITDNLNESFSLLENTFRRKLKSSPLPCPTQHAKSVRLTDRLRMEISELNALDLRLFQFAKNLFFQRLEFFEKFIPKVKRDPVKSTLPYKSIC